MFVSDPARADLTVTSSVLALTKSFTDDPVTPGGTVTLEFTLTNMDATQMASDIAFTDDLDATLSGLVATGLPASECGGTVSTPDGGMTVEFTGGILAAGASCTFSVSLMVPAMSLTGTFTNTTSGVTGTINSLPVTGDAASDDLQIDSLTLTKAFSGTVGAGTTVTLTFTIENQSTITPVTDLTFSDNLDAVISGLVAVAPLPTEPCGIGSALTGTSFLSLTGGNLLPSGSCTFPVTVQVPAAATTGSFPNTTSDLFSSGLPVADPATASLTIEAPPIFSKSFATNPIVSGQTSTLTFSIDNTANLTSLTDLDFSDNLPAGVVVAATPNASKTCPGGMVTADAGMGVISYSGGTLAAMSSCTVSVDVTSSTIGMHVNTTGDLTSLPLGNSGTASDTLTVNPLPGFSKSFAPNPIALGGDSTLTFTIDNTGGTIAASGLDFTDNLPAGVIVATPSNAALTCIGGILTALDGTGVITYTGGTVSAAASCTVTVDVTGTTAGMHVNTTGDLTSSFGNSGTLRR